MLIRRMVAAVFLLALAGLPAATAAQAETRLALVIGNSAYPTGPLPNPTRDAVLMAEALTDVGFKVALLQDQNNVEMYRAVVQFGRDLRTAGPEAIGLFFYAGHAVQADGQNYLIPIDANIHDELDLHPQSLSTEVLMASLRKAGNQTNIVILDACRDNPFAVAGSSNISSGLAKIGAPSGTMLAYSTEPGKTATDGEGNNSPYTHALARAIRLPNVAIEQTFKQVRNDVMERSSNTQIPWESTSLTNDFYFRPPQHAVEVVETEKSGEGNNSQSEAMEYWLAVRGSEDPVLLQSVVDRFPGTVYSELASVKLSSIETKIASQADAVAEATTQPPSQPVPSSNDPDQVQVAAVTTTRSAPTETADQMWQRIQTSNNYRDFEVYLERFPNGRHSKRVEARMAAFTR